MKAIQARMRRAGCRKSLLALSLLTAVATMGSAWAQSITGGLYGNERGGKEVTIEVVGSATGYRKILHPDSDGRYSLSGLNPGVYAVTATRDGKVGGTKTVTVRPNASTAVATMIAGDEPTAAGASQLSEVTVTAQRPSIMTIDVSTPELSNTYDMHLVNVLPTGRSLESIALLNSSVRYDDQTTGLVQIGGAGPSENRYYYNEFDTTNDYRGLGSVQLPAEALTSVQVMNSNPTVSYTSSMGGVMAATVRQGTNDFQAGYTLYYSPPTSKLLNPAQRDSYDSLGRYYNYASANSHAGNLSTEYAWASGAILKDTLFYFVMLGNSPNNQSTGYSQQYASHSTSRNKNGLVNLTWNISDDQSLNIYGYRSWGTVFTNSYKLGTDYTPASMGAYNGWSASHVKDQQLIGNYHWQITDAMALRLMWGYLSDSSLAPTSASNSGLPYVTEVSGSTSRIIGQTTTSAQLEPFDYWRRGYKGDFTWNLGDHKIMIGVEHYLHFLNSVKATTDGGSWTYFTRPGTNLPNGSPAPADGKYVVQNYSISGGQFDTINKAVYLDDSWQVADRWVAYAGSRFDTFINKNAVGGQFWRMPMTSPRVGVVWDVQGDSSMKWGANLGKYAMAIPSSVNEGIGGRQYTWARYYTYSGRDPLTQAPLGLTQIGGQRTSVDANGAIPGEAATTNLRPPFQYEFQTYLQATLGGSWVGKAEAGFAKLKRVVDDECSSAAIAAYAQTHGYPNYQDDYTCPEFNPGYAQVFTRDFNGDGKLENLTVPASIFGPPAKRNYVHLTLELAHSHSADEPYDLDFSYTWAHLYGNDDGPLFLGDRTAVGPAEQAYWDYPGVMEYGNGNLAGDIRHSLVASGVYYFSNGLRVGNIFRIHTGEPLSCLGTYPDPDNAAYGYWSHYCNGKPASLGTAGRLPTYWKWDVSIGYDWKINTTNKLSLDLQVQNITNRHGIIDRNQHYNSPDAYSTDVSPTYGASSFQAPRLTQLIMRYNYN